MQGSPFLPRISRPKAIFFLQKCSERMPGVVQWDGQPRPSLGSVSPNRAWEQRGTGRAVDSQAGDPHTEGVPALSLMSSPHMVERAFTCSGATACSAAYWTAPCTSHSIATKLQHLKAGMHPLQLYCPNSHFWENGGRESWWQQR